MSSFRDLLNNPLPSAYMESDDYDDDYTSDDTEEGCGSGCREGCDYNDYTSDDTEEGCGDYKSEHDDMDDDDDDELDDDISDDYNDDIENISDDDDDDDLDDDIVSDIENEVDDEVGDGVDDDELEVPVDDFTPEEEQEVEDETSLVATPIILKDELTAEEYADFGESVDADIAVDEGFLLESDIDIFSEDVMEESIKPMRFSKDSVLKARTNQIRWIVMRSLARKRNDPSLYKLEKAYKIRRKIKAQFEAKYGAKADQITRKYIARLKSSKSPVLARVGKKLGVKR